MRIGLAVSSREIFGSDRSALRLADTFRRLGHEPTLLVPSRRPPRGLDEVARQRALTVEEIESIVVSSRGVTGRPLRTRRARRMQFDVLVANSTAVAWVPAAAHRSLLMVREWLDPSRLRHRVLVRGAHASHDAVVGVSTGVVEVWKKFGRSSPTFVVHNWLEDQWFDQTPPLASNRDGILFLGRFNSWKGPEVLAAAYEAAFPSGSFAPRLTFIGAEEQGPFAARARELRDRSCGRWQVLAARADVRSALRRAALVVVPSLHPEPFGNVLLEALVCGCRVIAFPGGGPADLARDVPADALTVVERSVAGLARALADWAVCPEPQSAEVANATRTVLVEKYSEAAASSAWRSILGTL